MTLGFDPAEREALNEAHRIASSLTRFLDDVQPHVHPRPNDVSDHIRNPEIPQLDLPYPHDILEPLATLRVPSTIATELIQMCHRRVKELQQQYLQTYTRACLASLRGTLLLQGDLTQIKLAYEGLYRRQCIPIVKSWVSLIESKVAQYQPSVPSDSKRPFKNEYTPVLEKYFSLNGYPSVSHRSVLARRSGMTPRQIEVWFQNHRNRAKKEGKMIPRLNSDYPLKQASAVSLPDVPSCPHRLLTPAPEESTRSHYNEQIHVPKTDPSLVDDRHDYRPLHAFPATRQDKYPDPFPNDNGVFRFPAPQWRRKPATVSVVLTAIDMDEFTSVFHMKLNFSEISRRPGTTPPKPESPSFRPWFAGTTIFPSPAPLLALIRPPRVVPTPLSVLPSPLPNVTIKSTFGSISLVPSSSAVTITPSDVPVRKMMPLPRRIPTRSKFNPFSSRNSSSGSDTSSTSRVSSSSSSHSSPELSTPPPLPNLDLPVFHHEGQHQDLFDLSHTELDSDFSFSSLLPQDFNVTNVYPNSTKFTDILLFDNPFPNFSHNLGEIVT